MSKYQLLPPLSTAEYEALREDIAVAGVLVPIDIDENGSILDGHHRKQACDELGIECPTRTVDIPEFAKADYALTVNLARRHLNQMQRRQLVWNSVKDAPGLSDRLHARRCGVSPSTVADVRKDLEAADEVSKLDTRTDKRGRQQPAKKASGTVGTSLTDGAGDTGDGGDVSAAVSGNPNTAAEGSDLTSADGDDRTAAGDSPAAGPGAPVEDGEADRPGPAVTPTDPDGHQPPAGDAALEAPGLVPSAGGDETDPEESPQGFGAVDGRGQQDLGGVSEPAAPGPRKSFDDFMADPAIAIATTAEVFGGLDIEVVGPQLSNTDMDLIEASLARIKDVVALLRLWQSQEDLNGAQP